MASIIGATAARGNSASLLSQGARLGRPIGGFSLSCGTTRTLSSLTTTTTSCQRMMPNNIQTAGSVSVAATLSSSSTITTQTHPLNLDKHASLGSIRLFGRKASKMGHHIQSLDEMAHKDSREEARNRREEKKKKSKKARMSSSKESAATVDESDNEVIDDNISVVDEDGNQLLPEPDTVRSKMLLVIASIERSFSTIRGGEATPEMFDAVRVSAYGEVVPLSSVGQVIIEDAQRATISCYDPSVASDVRDAVRDMPGLSLNPYLEEGGSGVVIIPIPRVSEETRKEIVKELGRQAENGRQRVRQIRRTAMDIVKKGKDGKLEGISKDDAFRVGKDVDSVTEEVLSVLNGIVDQKQKSVMDD